MDDVGNMPGVLCKCSQWQGISTYKCCGKVRQSFLLAARWDPLL